MIAAMGMLGSIFAPIVAVWILLKNQMAVVRDLVPTTFSMETGSVMMQNNLCACNWDGGDCCLSNTITTYCDDCACLDPSSIS